MTTSPYRRLSWAAGISGVGDGAFAAAVPLLAVAITSDPRLVSVVSAATYLPWLLLSLPAGVLVDRYDRIGLMWRSQAIQAVIVGAVAILVALGHMSIPVLAVAAFCLGSGAVLFANAAQTVLPEIVGKPLLHRANAHQQAINTIGPQFAGPPLGSLLFTVAAALPFGIDAATFLLSAALLATMPRRPRRRTEHLPMGAAIADGLRWLAGHRLLRALALLVGVNSFCFQLGNATLVLLATQTLHLDARGYGLLLAGAALGSLLAALVGARAVERAGTRATLLVSLAANVAVFAGIGLSPNAVVLGVLLALNGFVTTLWNIVTVGLRQHLVPADLLGRVNGAYRMLGWGLIPLGALAGGLVAHAFGLRAPYPVAGVLRGIALLVALPVLMRALTGDRVKGTR
ncbi:MFS transporter [Nonomuraea purpurea]|uniref:MFS transporter n=1 Tax=Nonomuraea purpurea TaxID=1849276 RepID=A0ABV8GN44_9ACTN